MPFSLSRLRVKNLLCLPWGVKKEQDDDPMDDCDDLNTRLDDELYEPEPIGDNELNDDLMTIKNSELDDDNLMNFELKDDKDENLQGKDEKKSQ